MDKDPLLEGLELLGARLACAATNDQLSAELPLKRHLPVLLDLLVDNRVVVLQVGTEALGLEGDPEGVLVDGGCVLGPVAKVVGVLRESLAKGLYGLGVFEEEDLEMKRILVSGRGF